MHDTYDVELDGSREMEHKNNAEEMRRLRELAKVEGGVRGSHVSCDDDDDDDDDGRWWG